MKSSLSIDFVHHLQSTITGEVRSDPVSRLLYSTDASIYQIEPLGVVFPKVLDDLPAIVEVCAAYGVPLVARGAGSSLAGQAIGHALIVDCARYLNRPAEIDLESSTAWVEPGLTLNALNRAAAQHGLQFGPDPASAERATLGGSLANNATGAHSILYGMAADHLLEADVTLADGGLARLAAVTSAEAERRAVGAGREAALYGAALRIRQEYAETIRQRWPRTWRRASGYGLNYLLPWSPSQPPGWGKGGVYPPVGKDEINLAALLAGSEGTLAVIRRAKVRLVSLPLCTLLAVLSFPSIAEACDATPVVLAHHPAAVELIPQAIIRLARSAPAYAAQLKLLGTLGDPAALLVVEFAGDSLAELKARAQALGMAFPASLPLLLAETAVEQRQVWAVRKVGLGILMSMPGDTKPWAFIEDMAVPVERLGEFVRGMESIFQAYGTTGEVYAHASAGCLHFRPLLNLKAASGVAAARGIAQAAVALVVGLGGVVSGEHGDGLARSEWLPQLFGDELMAAFRELKRAADPQGLLNPGKIVMLDEAQPLPRMDDARRFGGQYQTSAWQPVMDFSAQGGLVGAIELCNGAGVCRKAEGVMCPSFQASQEEMNSTRGRANLLRALISGRFPGDFADLTEAKTPAREAVRQALDLCLACKGCKAECPSGVDMAKLKYEFACYEHSAAGGGRARKLRDYLFGYIEPLAHLAHPFAPLLNPLLRSRWGRLLAQRLLGLAAQRSFPRFSSRSLRSLGRNRERGLKPASGVSVLLLSDAFNEYFHPTVGLAALDVLGAIGCEVTVLPVVGAGRTLISKGFLEAARQHAWRLVEAVRRLDPQGVLPVVGLEPSEIYTLLDEYPDLLPGNEYVGGLARRSWTVEEFLLREGRSEVLSQRRRQAEMKTSKKVLLHAHCYQKARPLAEDGLPVGAAATAVLLEACGYVVQTVNSGCCGMAGAFGYEAEHYQLSQQVGELALLPAVRNASSDTLIAASGTSCRSQIEDGAGRQAVHPILLI